MHKKTGDKNSNPFTPAVNLYFALEEALKMTEAESVETPIQEERLKPDLTEVIEPEPIVKNAKPLVMRTLKKKEEEPPKPVLPNPAEMTDDQRKRMLDVFHNEQGKFEDISNEELKMERDQSNRAQYLADVGLTKEEADALIMSARSIVYKD